MIVVIIFRDGCFQQWRVESGFAIQWTAWPARAACLSPCARVGTPRYGPKMSRATPHDEVEGVTGGRPNCNEDAPHASEMVTLGEDLSHSLLAPYEPDYAKCHGQKRVTQTSHGEMEGATGGRPNCNE